MTKVRAVALLLALGVLTAGCATYHAYDGPRRPAEQVAMVSGTAKLRTATPLALVIRAVDDRPVDVRYSRVALTPGRYRLLVDCQLGEQPGTASRHSIDVEVGAGERYRLTAEMRPGNRACLSVDLEAE